MACFTSFPEFIARLCISHPKGEDGCRIASREASSWLFIPSITGSSCGVLKEVNGSCITFKASAHVRRHVRPHQVRVLQALWPGPNSWIPALRSTDIDNHSYCWRSWQISDWSVVSLWRLLYI